MATPKLRYSKFKHAIDIDAFEEAIGFSPISTSGGNDVGYCLWPQNHKHGDTTGKFGIHREKQIYNCYVCGGGDFLSLAMELFDFNVEEATEWLYQFAHGEQQGDAEFGDYLLAMLDDIEERVTTAPYFNERVLDRFDGSRDYFRGRGISDAVIEAYHLCYGETVMKPAPVKTDRHGQKVKIDEDYFGPAAIFPHYWQGQLVGWQHRWIDFEDAPVWLKKYTNTSDFPKETTLFNYDAALKARDRIVVVESVPTVLFLASYGFPAVSFFGSKPSPAQLRLLRRFSQGVILAPDNDSNMAGDKVLGSVTYLERFIPVYIADKVEGPDGADLGHYANEDDPYEALQWHFKKHVHTAGFEV